MKRILIPTDFSENAMNAVRYALECFKNDKAEFYLLHAYQDEVYNNHDLLEEELFEEVLEIAKNRSQLKLDLLLNEVKTIAPNPKFKFHLVSAYNALLDEVDKLVIGKNIDLIVMGTKGESANKSYAFGSNTLQVLKYVSCPVLVIPEYYGYKQPKHVLFPTNFLIPYKKREMELVADMLSPFKSVVEVLYISKVAKLSKRQKDNQEFIKDELDQLDLNFKTIQSKKVSKAITAYAADHKIDLLIMVNTSQSFLEDMLFRSKVDDICLHTDIPFLALQNIRRTV
ncbi:universal stress protein [Winogradskyella aurantia]|uniref:Universal stress protein n=1 Tax=Winogradskyella aurantia TaxID=1915063 RepID=A0A265UWM6_9FLAO|nr:universal stress protein [Winogradskyella aurantia]OZV69711.1 universal stress protein [Winogradskyella aurantia]